MKKVIALCMTGFMVCTAFIKSEIIVADYRDSYVGNYVCSQNCRSADASETNSTITIAVTKDVVDSILTIHIGKGKYQVKLKNNSLLPYPEGKRWGGNFFATDSISFISMVGLGQSCSYIGKKN